MAGLEKSCIMGLAVKINNKMGPYFQSTKGVQQGDSLSPMFKAAVECSTKMVTRAQENKCSFCKENKSAEHLFFTYG